MSRLLGGIGRVAVVGGGGSGLVTLQALLEQETFDEVVLFERREDIGGVWLFDASVANEEARRYAQNATMQYPFFPDGSEAPKFPSPAYEGMVGNIAHELITISGRPFKDKPSSTGPADDGLREETDLFPTLDGTIEYLRSFADEYNLRKHMQFNTEVVSTRREGHAQWKIVTKNLHTGEEATSLWDAVVYAAGLWDRIHVPVIPGIESIPKSRLLHARFYRSSKVLEGKRILVLGNANSANDISAHAAPIAIQPVYRSIRHASYYSYVPDERIQDVAPVQCFQVDPVSQKVTAQLSDGTTIVDIDLVVTATGYRWSVPSLRIPSRADVGQDEPITHPDGRRILGLYRHIFHSRFPTLAFVGYTIAWGPFANSQAQACVIARAWAGRIVLPSEAVMVEDEPHCLKEVGDTNLFHVLGRYTKKEWGYGTELREWALQGGCDGTVGVEWTPHRIWLLQNMVRLKTLQLRRERGLE